MFERNLIQLSIFNIVEYKIMFVFWMVRFVDLLADASKVNLLLVHFRF